MKSFVSFATQKGGIGKSTVTALAASYPQRARSQCRRHRLRRPQHSIHGLRERETTHRREHLYFKALACDHFRKITQERLSIIASDALDALTMPERMLAEEDGNRHRVLRHAGHAEKQRRGERPVADGLHLRAHECRPLCRGKHPGFAVMFRDNLADDGHENKRTSVPVLDDGGRQEERAVNDLYEDVIAEMGLSVLSTRLPDSKKFRRDLSKSARAYSARPSSRWMCPF